MTLIEALQPESPYVFYSDDHGFCINTADVMDILNKELKYHWIPCSEKLPENDNEVLITVWDAEDDYVEVYKGFYQDHEWWTQWCHGCLKIKDEPCGENIVIAWMPLPEAYKVDPCNGCDYLGESCVGEGCGKLTERKGGEADETD